MQQTPEGVASVDVARRLEVVLVGSTLHRSCLGHARKWISGLNGGGGWLAVEEIGSPDPGIDGEDFSSANYGSAPRVSPILSGISCAAFGNNMTFYYAIATFYGNWISQLDAIIRKLKKWQ
ncbi:MAG: hypothetical protein U0974_01090 [Gemmatimonadales bacterium]|nr:hypothetical protein [Gemmatimonadales bacterium]MDZ4388311.1 hypothetical protein [Gemmatimonadales bacterium]